MLQMYFKTCNMGESRRLLIKRIAEHYQLSSKSAITKHIYSCPAYLDALKQKFGEIPTRKLYCTKYFLAERFSIIEKYVYNYNDRTLIEALAITFLNFYQMSRCITKLLLSFRNNTFIRDIFRALFLKHKNF